MHYLVAKKVEPGVFSSRRNVTIGTREGDVVVEVDSSALAHHLSGKRMSVRVVEEDDTWALVQYPDGVSQGLETLIVPRDSVFQYPSHKPAALEVQVEQLRKEVSFLHKRLAARNEQDSDMVAFLNEARDLRHMIRRYTVELKSSSSSRISKLQVADDLEEMLDSTNKSREKAMTELVRLSEEMNLYQVEYGEDND